MRWTTRGGAVLVTLGLVPVSDSVAAPFSVEPPAEWVIELPREASAPVPERQVEGGYYELLRDDQCRVVEGTVECYRRLVRRVLSPAGVESVAEVTVTFDPSFERLTLHHARIERDGSIRDALDAEDVRIVQREPELERRIYDGRLSAIVFLEDVRPGDIVDVAFTRAGSNPVLEGKFVRSLDLGGDIPIHRRHARLLWLSTHELHVKAHRAAAARREEVPGGRSYTWDIRNVPPVRVEERIPPWHDPWPWVEVSDFASWGEVARQASRNFAVETTPPEVQGAAAPWRSLPLEERALAAIRFVQDDVRYLGIETGASSHRPSRPEEVLARRYGDCKDKARLLVALLRELGIEARPALVDTRARRGPDDHLPSPFAFDHVIVRAKLGDHVVWVDATAARQGGTVRKLRTPPFERALIVGADVQGLTEIPAQATEEEPAVLVEESFVTRSFGKPSTLRVKTTYRGREADKMRDEMAGSSVERRALAYRDFYGGLYHSVQSDGEPRFTDRREENVVVVEESYRIPDLWKDGVCQLHGWAVSERLLRSNVVERTMPLHVHHPDHVVHRIAITLPERFEIADHEESFVGVAFQYRSQVRSSGTHLDLSYSYRTKADALPPEEAAAHDALVAKAIDDVGFELTTPTSRLGSSELSPRQGLLISTGLLVGIAGIAAMVRAFRVGREVLRRRRLRRFTTFAAGSTAFTAIPVTHLDAIGPALQRTPCQCGFVPDGPPCHESVLFEDRRLTVVSRQCSACGRSQDVYFDVRPPAIRTGA